jgi:predicted transposase/invertase (TIGR01784 family)
MPAKYVSPDTDFGFKKLFGEETSKDLLIDFLNSTLSLKSPIAVLSFCKSENLSDIMTKRRAVFDIYCESEIGEKFIVELQKAEQPFFKDRSLFHVTLPICEQVEKSVWNIEFSAIYFIGILYFHDDEEKEEQKFERDVYFKDQDGNIFYNELHFKFLQMPLFTKTESELITKSDKWYYFLKHLGNLEQIPAVLSEPIFERAFETAELAKMTLQEKSQYESELNGCP